MAMSEDRKKEIGYQLFRYKMGQEGIRINSSMTREIGNVAKETGIPAAELKEFLRGMITNMLNDALKETRITVFD